MKTLSKILVGLFLSISLSTPSAQADVMKEFVMSCTYGVLAGTLVGAATLAFESQPGKNLNKVARGASLGLYAGILLGVYVTQMVPGSGEEEYIEPEETEGEEEAEEEASFRMMVYPIISRRGVEGVATQMQIFSF